MRRSNSKLGRALWLAAAIALGGGVGPACVPLEEEVTATPPPAVRTEVATAPPYEGAVWVPGHWRWTGTTHVWEPGYWQAPREGWVWENQRWTRRGERWVYVPGYWRRM